MSASLNLPERRPWALRCGGTQDAKLEEPCTGARAAWVEREADGIVDLFRAMVIIIRRPQRSDEEGGDDEEELRAVPSESATAMKRRKSRRDLQVCLNRHPLLLSFRAHPTAKLRTRPISR